MHLSFYLYAMGVSLSTRIYMFIDFIWLICLPFSDLANLQDIFPLPYFLQLLHYFISREGKDAIYWSANGRGILPLLFLTFLSFSLFLCNYRRRKWQCLRNLCVNNRSNSIKQHDERKVKKRLHIFLSIAVCSLSVFLKSISFNHSILLSCPFFFFFL